MSPDLKIAIVGIGNLGWNLSQRLFECGFNLTQVVGAKSDPNKKFAQRLNAKLLGKASDVSPENDLVFLCVPDDQITDAATQIIEKLPLVHCSGSTPVIANRPKSGVFYPFQTFTKFFAVDWTNVPIFIESNEEVLGETLTTIAGKVSGNSREVSLAQRQAVHLAGVYGANFVNHVLYMAKQVLDSEKVAFEVLEPLLKETIRKAFEHGPAGSQTGPARRGDIHMVNRHLEMLEKNGDLATFYRLFSDSIVSEYHSK